MALWRLQAVGDRVTLTYFESVRPGGKPAQKCGDIEALEGEVLEGWTLEQAAPWDICVLTNGENVVRQVTPMSGARA